MNNAAFGGSFRERTMGTGHGKDRKPGDQNFVRCETCSIQQTHKNLPLCKKCIQTVLVESANILDQSNIYDNER